MNWHTEKFSKHLQSPPGVSYSGSVLYNPCRDVEGGQQDPGILPFMESNKTPPPPCFGWLETFVCLPQKVLSVLLESCVCLLYWKVLSVCVFWYVCNYCLNMELRQKWIRYFYCFCCHHLPVITTTRVAFMARAQNLSLSSLITGFKLAGGRIYFWCE